MEVVVSMVVVVGVVMCAWKLVEWGWLRPKQVERCLRRQGLSGNPYRFLQGDYGEMSEMRNQAHSAPIGLADYIAPRIDPFAVKTLHNYGKKSFMWLGPTPAVNITDAKLIKEILGRFHEFQKPMISPLQRFLVTGLVSLEGPKWAHHRKIINPAFHLNKLKLASDAIARTAFGSSFEDAKIIFYLQRQLVDLSLQAILHYSAHIPGWRFLPTRSNRRMKQLDRQITAAFRGLITTRETTTRSRDCDDLLSMMLESNRKEVEEVGKGLTMDDVIEECKGFCLAGHEAASSVLNWTLILLSLHPQWQQRAREEVVHFFGRAQLPHFQGLNQLKVVSMIVHEVVRLYPPAERTYRMINQETKLGDMVLPAGIFVQLHILLIHHDKHLWGDDASEFKPERFRDGVAAATKNQPASFLPFGGGPRICMGQNYGLMQTKLVVAMLLQRFSFELSASYEHAPWSVVTVQPQHGTRLVLRKLID